MVVQKSNQFIFIQRHPSDSSQYSGSNTNPGTKNKIMRR